MNSSIALRLLWKEYRVQRGLWLSMAVGSFILQALIAFLMPDGADRFQGTVPVAFMLTFFYAIGSGAITFAIEREDGTQLRPVMMGCPPGLTLTVKTLFGVTATALLLILTMGSGMVMSLGSLHLPPNTIHPESIRMIIPLTLLFVVLPYVGGLLWSMFFSLLTRKVIVALGLAAIAMIVCYAIVAIYAVEVIDQPHLRRHDGPMTGQQIFLISILPVFIALLILSLNYLLTRRWLTRVFFDQTRTKVPSFFRRWRIRRSGFDGGMVVEIGVEDRTAFEVISPDVAAHQPPPRFGLGLLYATWGANLWRHLRFLRWKEAIETRKIFVGFLLATSILTFCGVVESFNGTGWHGVAGFFIHAACVACGVMAFRAEQDDRKVQRLADMGLRPSTVWLSKHLVWLVRAVICVAVLVFCVLLAEWLYPHSSSRMRVSEFLHGIWLNTRLSAGLQNHLLEVRLFGRAAILVVTLYGVGQVCSQLIRSTIVSLFVSFIVAVAVFGWAGACWWFDVPFSLSVLPLAIGCFLVTWFRTCPWMLDDNRPRAWTRPMATMAASMMIVYAGTGLFRVYQIPRSEPFFENNDVLTESQRAAVLAPVSEGERSTFLQYQRASELLGRNRLDYDAATATAKDVWQKLSEDDQKAVENAIDLAVMAANEPACAAFSPAVSNIADVATLNTIQPLNHAVELILFDARRQLEEGNPAEAMTRYRRALDVCRHAAGRGGEMEWWSSLHLTRQALSAIQEWARHPDVDAGLIDEAVAAIDDHRRQMLPIEVTNYAGAVMVRNTLDADAYVLADLVEENRRVPMLLATKFPGEHTRSHRLLNVLESYDVASMESYREWQASTGSGSGMVHWVNSHLDADAELRNFAQSSLQTTPLLAYVAGGPASRHLCLADIDIEVQSRATKLLIRLLAERRQSGTLPETLNEFDESLNDPWTGQPFTWYSKGLPGDLKQGSAVIVEAHTPFFMTGGQDRSTIQRIEYHEPFAAGASPGESMMGGDSSLPGSAVPGAARMEDKPAGNNTLGAPAAGAAEANDDPPATDDDRTDRETTRVEYVLWNGQYQQVRGSVIVWQLPRRSDARTEDDTRDEDDE